MKYLILAILLHISQLSLAFEFPEVKVQRINDHIFAMLGPSDIPNVENGGFVNNNLVIIGDKGVILVDAGSHKSVAEHIYKSIKAVTRKPITHIIITHHHSDHHLGAQYYEGAKIIATEFAATQIYESSFSMVDEMRNMSGLPLKEESPLTPDITIPESSNREMEIHGVKFNLISTNTAHTHGDLMVWLPDDFVLASGDVLVHKVNPNFNDGSLKSWIEVVNKNILSLPFKTVMPGHGSLMNRYDVENFQKLISEFYQTVEGVYLNDGEESDIREVLDLEKWKQMKRYEAMMGRNINKVWLEVEEANF